MQGKQPKILLFLVCVVLGIMISTQFRSSESANRTIAQQRAEDLSGRLKATEKENEALKAKVKTLEENTGADIKSEEVLQLKADSGYTAMTGPGVIVTVDDSKVVHKPGDNPNLYIIHDDDLLRIINELRAAGAEALSINKERIIDVSEIRCAGPTVSVNNTRFSPPYEIKAIGNGKTLESALKLRGGVVETLKLWGISVDVVQKDNVVIPAFKGPRHYEFAKVKDGDK
jgi:uncharacterized protein YlxW (UPF0749 family)